MFRQVFALLCLAFVAEACHGGGASRATNPVPTIDGFVPAAATAGEKDFNLLINGTGFVNGTTIRWNNKLRPAIFVSEKQLTLAVSAVDVATARIVNITASNSAPGGGESEVLPFVVNNPLPAPTALRPATLLVDSGAFTLTVMGTNFVAGSQVQWADRVRPTLLVQGNLTATISANDVAIAKVVKVTVQNPTPGGGLSVSTLDFAVANPIPTTSAVDPASVTLGAAALALTVTGTHFVAGSMVQWGGQPCKSTFVDATRLTAEIPAAYLATAALVDVTVQNDTPGGGTSNATRFTVENPVPTLSSVSPQSVEMGAAAFTLTLTGINFVEGSSVAWNGTVRQATFKSKSELLLDVAAEDVAAGGYATLAVQNPTPGGGLSDPTVKFAVNNPTPLVSSAAPTASIAAGPSFSLTVTGKNFVPGAAVNWNGAPKTTTFGSPTELVAQIAAADIAGGGSVPVTVTNPIPGGGTSTPALTFLVTNPLPTATLLAPNAATTGGPDFMLTVTGTKFVLTSAVNWNGAPRATVFQSSTTLIATILAADIASAGIGAYPVTVTNPTPGGGVSSPSLYFGVTNPQPTISSVEPNSAVVGSASLAITIHGTGFFGSSQLMCGSGACSALQYVGPTQYAATIPAIQLSKLGTFNISVINASPGGGSASMPFTVGNPLPIISSLSPTAVDPATAFTLTVNGSNFLSGSQIVWAGAKRATTLVASQLVASISAIDVLNGGSYAVSVINPSPGGGASNVALMTVNLVTNMVGASSFAAGAYHTCALANGGVQCWGDNRYGQLGTVSGLSQSAVPVQVVGVSDGAQAVAAGEGHSCALVNGAVLCWGRNSEGQIGNNTNISSATPAPVSGLGAGVQAIVAGQYHSCALVDGTVKCWGRNDEGELGNNNTVSSNIPVSVAGLSGVQTLAAAGGHTCAVANGGLKCWGSNLYGQLGDNSAIDRLVPVSVSALTSGAQTLALGENHSCAVSNGSLWCWGDNSAGQLGNNKTTPSSAPLQVALVSVHPTQYATGAPLSIAAGQLHTCAVVSGGLQCWGNNAVGLLGNNSTNSSLVPVNVAGLTSGVQAVTAGYGHTCAVANGALKCWGDNLFGDLGDNSGTQQNSPVQVSGFGKLLTGLAVGDGHFCVASGGGMRCWGKNDKGQLGTNGTSTIYGSPFAGGVQSIAANSKTTCALVDGTVRCWGGFDSSGVWGGLNWDLQSVTAGSLHACALWRGTPVCFGDDFYNQISACYGAQFVPGSYQPCGLSDVQTLAAGDFNTCALTGGGVFCWGNSSWGGNHNYPYRGVYPVSGLAAGAGVQAITAGLDHNCALVKGGVSCWGTNNYGQLGDGTLNDSTSAVTVVGLTSGVHAIAAGGSHTCALVNGGVSCWGRNATGELGNNSTVDSKNPVAVIGLTSGVQAIATGESQTCAMAGGQIVCWGLSKLVPTVPF